MANEEENSTEPGQLLLRVITGRKNRNQKSPQVSGGEIDTHHW